jgi:hypothetical protein
MAKTRARKAFFSGDALVALLLAATAAAVLFYALGLEARSFSDEARTAKLQANAFAESERALKTCVEDGGLARCDAAGFVYANELERKPAERTTYDAMETEKETETLRVCVTRIVLVGETQEKTSFCADG